MKNLLITLTVALALGAAAEAGDKKCCAPQPANCNPCASARWYKAKDGTYREMMPYWKALSRAEDADDMEPVLKKTQEELTAAKAATDAANAATANVQAELAKVKADMEAQIAELRKQLDAEKQAVASQKDRADKAEAAHKLCIEQVATLREEAKKNEETLAGVRGELKNMTSERDTLKAEKDELEKKLADASSALKNSQDEVNKLKQEAAESKKAQVEEEKKAAEEPKPEDKPAEEPKPADGGEAPPAENK